MTPPPRAGQLRAALVRSPGALLRLDAASLRWLLAYLLLAAVVLGALAFILLAVQGGLRRAVLTAVVPQEIFGVADLVTRVFFGQQTQQLLANALVTTSLLVVSLVLFRVKERLSRAVERGQQLDGGRPYRSHPLWFEAFEEIKLLVVYGAAFVLVFWLGYDPAPWRKIAATTLSYVIMGLTWAIDFCAPTMQRHGLRYSQIIKAILGRPVASVAFGLLFALPVVGVAQLASTLGASPVASVAVIFTVNLLAIGCAAIAGTWLGAWFLPVAESKRPSRPAFRALTWGATVAVLAAGLYLFALAGQALVTKSQILKCQYRVDWSSLTVETPSLGGLIGGELRVGVGFDVVITNPTALPVRLEDNRIVLTDGEKTLAEGSLAPLSVDAHASARQRAAVSVAVKPGALLQGVDLNPAHWHVTLYVRVTDRIELPIYLRAPG